MKIAIQQPEHLPWIGFFNKMTQCDLFIFLDNVQFKKRYFENRNKILTKDGVKWVTVPVLSKGKYTQDINNVKIDNETTWRKKYLGILEHAYNKHPGWKDMKGIINPVLDKETEQLLDVNLGLIKNICKYLEINTETRMASELGVGEFSGNEIILELSTQTKASSYISGPDGRNYLKEDMFAEKGIKIIYHDFEHPNYQQLHFGEFFPHMSIMDLIANYGQESRKIVRDCYKITL